VAAVVVVFTTAAQAVQVVQVVVALAQQLHLRLQLAARQIQAAAVVVQAVSTRDQRVEMVDREWSSSNTLILMLIYHQSVAV
jgi:transposase-like protein